MTESDWFTCIEPRDMLHFLRNKSTDRKVRLFACACCRRVWEVLSEPACRAAVEVAEAFADGDADGAELGQAREAAYRVHAAPPPDTGFADGATGISRATWEAAQGTTMTALQYDTRNDAILSGQVASSQATTSAGYAVREQHSPDFIADQFQASAEVHEREQHVSLIRCIFGNPFRKPSIETAWLTQDVVQLANAAYEERSLPDGNLKSDQLSALSDALEAAGCSNQEILSHLRDSGPHVRGCWAVDLILGRA